MISRRLAVPLMLVTGAFGFAGCSDNGVHYGPPDGLTGKLIPEPTFAKGGAPDAGPPIDAGPCSVSWSSQIFPSMMSTGKWKCAQSSCHGGLQAPKMSDDPGTSYASLVSYVLPAPAPALPYLLPGETNPAKSGIECNLSGTTCDSRMPLTQNGATILDANDIATLDTWVKCGAPDN